MDVVGIFIFWGFIWVILVWRCFAVRSICTEVAAGNTTADALLFQGVQAGISMFCALTILRPGPTSLAEWVVAIAFIFTSLWTAYSCAKAGLAVRKKKQNPSEK